MFRNYLTVAFRNLLRYKIYSCINIAGLSIGMASCILILLFIQNEISYDAYHENADRIYRVAHETALRDGRMLSAANSPPPLAPTLREAFPEVLQAVRFAQGSAVIGNGSKRFEAPFFFADASVFKVFDWHLIKGNPETALSQPYSLVLTEKAARKYFGSDDPLGKVLTLGVTQDDYKVTGILEEMPRNSHFHFDILASFASLHEDAGLKGLLSDWMANPLFYTYVLLPEGYRPEDLEHKLPDFVKKYMGNALATRGESLRFFLQPLTQIHLHSHLLYEIEPTGKMVYIYAFAGLACFILLLACINFMNLSTARSLRRAKEVGLRKVIGAYRDQLIFQFLGESLLLASIALLIGISLAEFLVPAFDNFAGQQLAIDFVNKPSTLSGVVVIAILTGLLGGSYPAFVLSAFQPADVIKGAAHPGPGKAFLRQALVTIQFAISLSLIIGTAIMYAQMKYVDTKNLGFSKEQVLALPMLSDRKLRPQYESIKAEILQNPEVLACTASSEVPLRLTTRFPLRTWPLKLEDSQDEIEAASYAVDYDFVKTLGIHLIAGRDFSRHIATDASKAFIINETAAKRLGWHTPEEAVGRPLIWRNRSRGIVVGVVKDFHTESLYQEIKPLLLRISPGSFYYLLVRLRPGWNSNALASLKKEWQTHEHYEVFKYSFLDTYFDQLYKADKLRGQILGVFSLLAVFVACLGLFGLASYTAEQRTKEIGIRKVLGATDFSIVHLLSKDFLKPVLLANFLAWPIAYYEMSRWLQDFSYHIDIGARVFALSGMLAMIIALLTVVYQAVKAARANPVEALRQE